MMVILGCFYALIIERQKKKNVYCVPILVRISRPAGRKKFHQSR